MYVLHICNTIYYVGYSTCVNRTARVDHLIKASEIHVQAVGCGFKSRLDQ